VTTDVPVIIEVAVNGVTTKARNPEVPDTPDTVADDAVRCLDEGAAIIHSHTTQMGMPSVQAAEEYATIFRRIRARRDDGILYPTMNGGTGIKERFDHHLPLADEGLIGMAVIDPGSINMTSSGPDGSPPDSERVYTNSPADISYMMDVCRRQRLGPSFGVYEPGFMRMVLVYHESGQLAAGSMSKFYFSGEGYFEGGMPTYSAPPIAEALELYLAMRADAPLTWGVAVLGGSVLDAPVARMAVERGGHLRIGLEDWGRGPGNVEQVRRAVALCHDVGRAVATPDEARRILGLTPT
jgi:uncharacterized protein (DUF849 family)